MAKFDVTNYIKDFAIAGKPTRAPEILEWLLNNVGPYDATWLDETRLTAAQVTNYAIGTTWSLNVVAETPTVNGEQARGFKLNWILEIEDDTAAMQFKLIWSESKLK